MRELAGVFVPVPTPYKGDEVATARLGDNLRQWSQAGLDGFAVLGSTGEFPLLSEAERDAVLVAARDAIPRDHAMLAGTGSASTLWTIRQTKRAAEIGADAAIVIPPHSLTPGISVAAAQVRHYLAVAEASPIPIVLGNAPLYAGVTLEPDTVARIAEHPNVSGIEDCSGNILQIAEIIHLTPKSFHVLVGSAAALLPGLAIGSSGGILGLAALAARDLAEIYALARQGRWEEAKEIAARMMRADRGVIGRYGLGGLKAALDLQGLYGGPCRAPLGTPDGDAIDDIKESLASAGLL